MRSIQTTLYSFAVPAMFLAVPLMRVTGSDIMSYLRGSEFRQFAGEIVIQISTGVADALLLAIFSAVFGL